MGFDCLTDGTGLKYACQVAKEACPTSKAKAKRPPKRTNSNIKRRNWKRSVHQSLPKCTKEPVAVCLVVCQTCLVPLVVTLLVLLLVDQPLRKSINNSVFAGRPTYA